MEGLFPASVVAVAVGAIARVFIHSTTLVIATSVFAGFLVAYQLFSHGARRSLPPGPRRIPIIGNALAIPKFDPWITFSRWQKTYGDIIYLEILGRPMVILNSSKIAKDLLDKRSSLYSDRPHLVMAGDLCGYLDEFALQPYGDYWRAQRKLVSQDFNQSAVPRYYSIQELEARRLTHAVLNDPTSLIGKTKLHIAAIIMRVTYGYPVKKEDDPMITLPMKAMDNFSAATAPGAFLVDFIPQLRYLPEWMPGAGFLRTAKVWRKTVWDASWNPYNWCKENLDSGIATTPNLCATTLQQADGRPSDKEEHTVVWAASAVMGGGLDTNMSTIFTFILAMLRYPSVQAKAQLELDRVVGNDRLPAITDRPSLPYIRSLIAEVFRWVPAVPLGLPHSLTQDDVYEGVYFPKGTLFSPNVWHMLHDPAVYTEPMEFKPERYGLEDSEMRKVTDLSFGFGRRACPGFYFAEGTIFAVISTLLAICNIVPTKDARGNDIIPELKYTPGSIIFPENVQCNFIPRTTQARSLLAQSILASE
ncbi:cytochrome P450 [Laetiporus sulphureus 93-53]|uniref:Cytochrome P450 n=1 Tax=Laetiporus sulphureus 93-53 TaxID=1314785 RepID=A0A165I7H8_9APHY|nr:cytochrome P450 [Laetiporus sulphureus 93-53]KZT12691.1 cytochrome P450 [Laetiporus sulphureus 93-53]